MAEVPSAYKTEMSGYIAFYIYSLQAVCTVKYYLLVTDLHTHQLTTFPRNNARSNLAPACRLLRTSSTVERAGLKGQWYVPFQGFMASCDLTLHYLQQS